MTTNELRECPLKPWKPPFVYNRGGQWIQDSNGARILDMRGWGFLTGKGGMNLPEDEAAKIQDGVGEYVTTLLNSTRPAPVAAEGEIAKTAARNAAVSVYGYYSGGDAGASDAMRYADENFEHLPGLQHVANERILPAIKQALAAMSQARKEEG